MGKLHKLTVEQIRNAIDTYEGNREIPISVLAKELGVTPPTLGYHFKKHGVVINKKWKGSKPTKVAVAAYDRGRKYGISGAAYTKLREEQKDCCAICGIHEDEMPNQQCKLCVDHDHDTNQVRGLLCSSCNSGLGYLCDDVEMIDRAIAYLIDPPAYMADYPELITERPSTPRLDDVRGWKQRQRSTSNITQEEVHEMRQLYEYGESMRDIGTYAKRATVSVKEALEADGVTFRPKGGQVTAAHISKYGLSYAGYNFIATYQEGRCPITLNKLGAGSRTCVDHDHKINKVRGLIAHLANLGIGHFNDDVGNLVRAKVYLSRSGTLPKSRTCSGTSTSKSPAPIFTPVPVPVATDGVLIASAGIRSLMHAGYSKKSARRFYEDHIAAGVTVILPNESYEVACALRAYKSGSNTAQKIGARKTDIRELTKVEADAFLDEYHLQGSTPRILVAVGLIYEGEIVACMTFTDPSTTRSHKAAVMLQRFATSASVPGAASKLLTWYKRTYAPESIISYSDPRYASGGMYEQLGFTLDREAGRGDYVYLRDGRVYSKASKQRKSLRVECDKHSIPWDDTDTEMQMAHTLTYDKVELPTKRRWVWVASI